MTFATHSSSSTQCIYRKHRTKSLTAHRQLQHVRQQIEQFVLHSHQNSRYHCRRMAYIPASERMNFKLAVGLAAVRHCFEALSGRKSYTTVKNEAIAMIIVAYRTCDSEVIMRDCVAGLCLRRSSLSNFCCRRPAS